LFVALGIIGYCESASANADRGADQRLRLEKQPMARPYNKLTDLQVKRRTQPGWLGDGGGLYLRVSPAEHGGGRRWVLRYAYGGRKREMGLGDADAVTLAEARNLRDEHLKLLRAGQDPLVAKQAAKRASTAASRTFKDAAESQLKRRQDEWRKKQSSVRGSSLETWRKSIAGDMKPLLAKSVAAITAADVIDVVRPYWNKGALASARRLWDRVKMVLDHAIALEWRAAANPLTRERFKNVAPKRPPDEPPPHHAALDWRDMPAFMAKLRAKDAISSLAVQFMALTACRSNEARAMQWTEVNWAAKTWTVPPGRMKAKAERPHVVPLSSAALALLSKLDQHRVCSFPFWGLSPDRPVSSVACWRTVRRVAGRDATVHGVRASFRSWCDDHGVARDLAEKALAHVGDALDQAYRRSDMLEPRRDLMEKWAQYLSGECSHVVVAIGERRRR
jgi:integrase